MGNMLRRRLKRNVGTNIPLSERPSLTGIGKCNRLEAIFSPGASKATTGAPNVTPRREASAPPSEWPGVMSG